MHKAVLKGLTNAEWKLRGNICKELEKDIHDKKFNLEKGECILVPKGVLHCPKTNSSATVLVFELKETKQYGD